MAVWQCVLLLVLLFAQQLERGDCGMLLRSRPTDTLSAAAPPVLNSIFYRSGNEDISAAEGAEPRRLLLGHMFSLSGLSGMPWPTEGTGEDKQDENLQHFPGEEQVQQPCKAKALGVRTLKLLQRAKRSTTAAVAAAAAAAIPKDEAGQRLLSGALTRLYVQTLLYPIDTLRARSGFSMKGISIASLYDGALPALLLGDVPYSIICGLVHLKATAALKKYAPKLPPLAASAVAALCADSAGVMYKAPHEAVKSLRQKGLASSTTEAMQMVGAATPALQRAMPVTIVRDAFFRFVNGAAAGKIRGFLQSRRQRSLRMRNFGKKVSAPFFDAFTPQQRDTQCSCFGLRSLGHWLQSRRAVLKGREAVDTTAEAVYTGGQEAKAASARAGPTASKCAEAALVGAVATSLAGVAASPLDAARAVVVRQSAADLEGSDKYSGIVGVARALHQAAAAEGLKGLFATAPMRVLLGGCCGAVAAAFNMRCMAALASIRAAVEAKASVTTETARAA